MMVAHGLPVEMTAEEFETGLWQRSILSADKLAEEERAGRRLFLLQNKPILSPDLESLESTIERGAPSSSERYLPPLKITLAQPPSGRLGRSVSSGSKASRSLAESVNMAEMARGGPISPVEDEDSPSRLSSRTNGRSRAMSLSSKSPTFATYMKLKEQRVHDVERENSLSDEYQLSPDGHATVWGAPSPTVASLPKMTTLGLQDSLSSLTISTTPVAGMATEAEPCHGSADGEATGTPWFERRTPHHGGEVCARILEAYMFEWDAAARKRTLPESSQ